MSTKSSFVILIVIILIGGIIYVYGGKGGTALPGGSTGGNTTSKSIGSTKESLLKRASMVDKTPLTEKEKITLFESLSAENSSKYGFTNVEKAEIIKALNK